MKPPRWSWGKWEFALTWFYRKWSFAVGYIYWNDTHANLGSFDHWRIHAILFGPWCLKFWNRKQKFTLDIPG